MVSLIKYMLTFNKIVELSSFVKTAEYYEISPPAVSTQIKKLENKLGYKLFNRTTRIVHLTERGVAFYEHTKKVQELLKNTEKLYLNVNENPKGELKIVVSEIICHQLLFKYLNEFITMYPEINLKIEIREEIPNFIANKIDFLIGFRLDHKELSPNLIAQKILSSKLVLVCTPEHEQFIGRPKSLKDIKKFRFIYHYMAPTPEAFDSLTGLKLELRQSNLLLNTQNAIISLILKNIGVSILPDNKVYKYLNDGSLIKLLPSFDFGTMDQYFFYDKGNSHLPTHKAFLNFIKEKITLYQNIS